MKKLLALLLVGAGVLFATNPDMEAFQDFVRTHAADQIQRKLGDGALPEALSGAGASLLSTQAPRITERRSYLVCSTYAVDLDRDGRPNGRVLGIAGQFVVLDEFSVEE